MKKDAFWSKTRAFLTEIGTFAENIETTKNIYRKLLENRNFERK